MTELEILRKILLVLQINTSALITFFFIALLVILFGGGKR